MHLKIDEDFAFKCIVVSRKADDLIKTREDIAPTQTTLVASMVFHYRYT